MNDIILPESTCHRLQSMSAPPTTPIPRRFLLPKRPPASSQTPAPQASQQFQSTPRFGSSSASRPTPRKAHEVEDVVDDGDSSDGEPDPRRGGRALDTIEIESDALTPQDTGTGTSTGISQTPSDGGHVSGTEPAGSPPEQRDAKRRRLSISPVVSSSPAADGGNTTPSRTSPGVSEDHSDGEEAARPQEPVFRAAPRFKVSEMEDVVQLLPDAFSPRRKGARYLPSGMAAQLQSWLSEVKGWEGTRDESAALRITVEEVSPGGRMYLVRGRERGSADAHADRASKAYLLAGEGKLTGLGRRAAVGVGGVVVVEEPMWEVTLLGEVWTVGCNWSVES